MQKIETVTVFFHAKTSKINCWATSILGTSVYIQVVYKLANSPELL